MVIATTCNTVARASRWLMYLVMFYHTQSGIQMLRRNVTLSELQGSSHSDAPCLQGHRYLCYKMSQNHIYVCPWSELW